MSTNVYKVIAEGIVDLTDKMSGTSADFPFEITEAFINGVSTSFTWTDGVLDIPTYTSGTVKSKFVLYLIYGSVSGHAPKDPTDSMSDIVFWEERIGRMPTMNSSIQNFEDGKITFKTSNIAFTALGGDWESLLDRVDFVGTDISCYLNDVLLYDARTNGSQVSNGKITIIIKNQSTALDEECNFGDPSYLNRIEADHNSSFYNGASIPEKYYGVAIPFIMGDRMAYQDFEGQDVDSGDYIAGSPPLIQVGGSITSRTVGTGFICRVIPVNATTGIVCRIPSWQSLNSSVLTDTAISISPKIFSKIIDGTGASLNIIPSQLVKLETTGLDIAGICLKTGATVYQLNSTVTNLVTWTAAHYDQYLHLCANKPPSTGFDPATASISYTSTGGGNRLVKITATGVDFTEYDHYLVCSNLSGSRSAPKVLQFLLESHGLDVDTASFDAMDSAYPAKTCIQVGSGKNIPTVNTIASQINRSLLTYAKIPLSGNDISMGDIDTSPTITDTLTDEEIRELSINVTGEDVYSRIEFEPIYAKGSIYRDDVYDYKENDEADTVYASSKTKTISHVLTSKPSRWQEIADFYGFPSPTVSFILLTDTLYSVGDYVGIDHSDFKGNIIITSVSPKQVGSAITGKQIS